MTDHRNAGRRDALRIGLAIGVGLTRPGTPAHGGIAPVGEAIRVRCAGEGHGAGIQTGRARSRLVGLRWAEARLLCRRQRQDSIAGRRPLRLLLRRGGRRRRSAMPRVAGRRDPEWAQRARDEGQRRFSHRNHRVHGTTVGVAPGPVNSQPPNTRVLRFFGDVGSIAAPGWVTAARVGCSVPGLREGALGGAPGRYDWNVKMPDPRRARPKFGSRSREKW